MSDNDDSTGKSIKIKFRRKLTPFLCREMLFDYATGNLDATRRVAMEEFLRTDKECQGIHEEIRKGIEYAEHLASLQVNQAVLMELRDVENAISLSRRYTSWYEWPETLRWSITAVMISMILAGAVAVVPWKNIPILRQWVDSAFKVKQLEVIEVAQLPRASDEAQIEAVQEQQEGTLPIDEGSGDEETEVVLEVLPDTDQAPVTVQLPLTMLGALALVPPSPTPNLLQASPGQLSPIPDSSFKTVAAEPTAAATETKATSRAESRASGFVSRAFMTLTNLDDIGPKIVDHIVELGGEKAGEVELGWERGTGRYYHFVLPEEGQERLLEKLRAYGPVRLSKDPHPRVMPAGQVRFILWIEAGNS